MSSESGATIDYNQTQYPVTSCYSYKRQMKTTNEAQQGLQVKDIPRWTLIQLTLMKEDLILGADLFSFGQVMVHSLIVLLWIYPPRWLLLFLLASFSDHHDKKMVWTQE